MNLLKPKSLKIGDKIAIIAPSGEIDFEKLEIAHKYFENKGYIIEYGKNIKKVKNYLAGTDEERLEDLHWAFSDNSIDAIFCARGGYGAIRLINKIDYSTIKNNPKIFCGYSDITALSAMFYQKTGLITFSAPMSQSDFSKTNINKFTENNFFKTLSSGTISLSPENEIIYRNGKFEGIIIAGNLTTFASLAGVEFIPNENFILMIEDIGENAYQIDRHLSQLLNINKFKNNLKGILLGKFTKTDNPQWLNDLFTDLAKTLSIPIIGEYNLSHTDKKLTIPYGAKARLKDSKLTISNYLSE